MHVLLVVIVCLNFGIVNGYFTNRNPSEVVQRKVNKLLIEKTFYPRKYLQKTSIEVLIKNVFDETGEGPHWDEDSQTLHFVDNLANRLFRWNYQTNVINMMQFDNAVTFVIPRQKGGLIIGYGKTVSSFCWDTKKLTVLAEVDHNLETRINDAKCDPKGRLWFGTMGVNRTPPLLPVRGLGSLYSLDIDGIVKKHMDNIWVSNGIAWSLDNRTMYFIDSIPGKLYAFDYDIEYGTIYNRRILVDFEAIGNLGYPDGMTVDAEDKIWVACYEASKVVRFDPKTGRQLQTINFPAKRITSCCFGGPNYDEMFVTSGRTVASEQELIEYPLSGSLFRVRGLGVKGLKPSIYKG